MKSILPIGSWKFVSLALLTALFVGCSTVPETGRMQLKLISPTEEMKLGLSEFQRMKQEGNVSRDAQKNNVVQRVGKRISAVADLPGAEWEFVVFDNPEPNAFCLPGGKIGVNTGIFPIAKNDAGMATIMGHEVAHAVARHGNERMSQRMALQKLGQWLGASVNVEDPKIKAWSQMAYGYGSELGAKAHGRKQESEADHIGLLYMARAGYNPEEAVAFWQRFKEYKGGGEPGNVVDKYLGKFLSTHPLDDKRIADLNELMPKAKAEYRPQ